MTSWPHAPPHLFNKECSYMITAATHKRVPLFKTPAERDLIQALLFELADRYKWKLEAWSIFPNHYHFIAQSKEVPKSLKQFVSHLHAASAKQLNALQGMPGRKVWYEFWDSKLTFSASYLSRLNYVMNNPVKHGFVENAVLYDWCSAAWFAKSATAAYFKSIQSFKTDTVNIIDDF